MLFGGLGSGPRSPCCGAKDGSFPATGVVGVTGVSGGQFTAPASAPPVEQLGEAVGDGTRLGSEVGDVDSSTTMGDRSVS